MDRADYMRRWAARAGELAGPPTPCACGCGGVVTSVETQARRGRKRGDRPQFIHGHNGRIVPPEPGVKWCGHHQAFHARSAFGPSKQHWDGLKPHCREALAERMKGRPSSYTDGEVDPLVVIELDDGVCGICGEDVDPFDFHVDHVIPVSRGGEHSHANVQAAHPPCNLRKHASVP